MLHESSVCVESSGQPGTADRQKTIRRIAARKLFATKWAWVESTKPPTFANRNSCGSIRNVSTFREKAHRASSNASWFSSARMQVVAIKQDSTSGGKGKTSASASYVP